MNMKHILILTGRFGMGHCSAAEAIRQQIAVINPHAQVQIVDLMEYLFPCTADLIYNGFSHMVNFCSALYNQLNRMAGKYASLPMKSHAVARVTTLLSSADLVVSTLPLCSQCVSAFKQKTGSSIPLYTYITDIGAQDEWITPCTDAYFVGAEETRQELMQKGVADSRIHVCGIPVRQSFLQPANPTETSDRLELLLMGGGLGLIPAADTFLQTLSQYEEVHVTVITGKNQALYDRLHQQYPTISVIGYTNQVADYMRRADLLITKSGGITTFEAIHTGTPLYIIRPFLMQEIGNARYIEQHHLGHVVWSADVDMTQDILSLLHQPIRLQAMRQNMKQLRDSLEEICPEICFTPEEMIS